MKIASFLLASAILSSTLAVTANAAAPVDWTKAGAVAAVQTAQIWQDNPPANPATFTSPIRIAAVLAATPYGPRRRLRGKVRAARWDFTVQTLIAPSQAPTTERFCVQALGPVRTRPPFTAFQIGGWAPRSTLGGCAHWAATGSSGSSAFEWGGSAAVTSHP